ncbi:MAG: GNAT family N-acetyltransferase [Acidilobus sp.]
MSSCSRRRLATLGSYSLELLCPSDAPLVASFYSSLDTLSLYYRFLDVFRDFEGHARRLFSGSCNYAVGGFLGDRIVALGEGFSNCTDAELAFAVMPEHRRRGLATVIAALLILEAYRRGIRTMEAYMHGDNYAAIRIGERLGLCLRLEEDVYHGRADVARIRDLALKVIAEKGGALEPQYSEALSAAGHP